MIEIFLIESDQYNLQLREIFWEYLQWVNERVCQEYNISFDIAAIIDHDMSDLSKFMCPSGRLLLGTLDQKHVGVACLKYLQNGYGEIKRM